ncbi:MarR family transcriptional regulator [Halobacteriales archaeon QH_10_67_13]|nr:MAG: MarR family transcriptional regulator [Halobacteriales archaeon QH_10_67_13]
MHSAELLDLLGNANRRRILRLLARRPHYVTEISDVLGVGPKAVIDHLEKLEAAGLVESRTDDRRRKYFSIARHVQLEVTVSPYEFGTKSAYPRQSRPSLGRQHLSIELDRTEPRGGANELARALRELEELDRELSLAKRWVEGQITELRERLGESLEEDPRLVAGVIAALAEDAPAGVETIAGRVELDTRQVAALLESLEQAGVVSRGENGWELA